MRYDDWDVILFSRDSHVPIQEFKTACYISTDESGTQLPVLTCYITSLPPKTPFRISVHSWATQPQPSVLIESQRRPDQRVVYLAQVVVDGKRALYSRGCFEIKSKWPQEIAYMSRSPVTTEHGSTEPGPSLEFPAFNFHTLMQTSWNARDRCGRIQIFLSEQLVAKTGSSENPQSGPRSNTVCFAFQHAPQELLEQTGISWPIRNPLYRPSIDNSARLPSQASLYGPRNADLVEQGHDDPTSPLTHLSKGSLTKPVLEPLQRPRSHPPPLSHFQKHLSNTNRMGGPSAWEESHRHVATGSENLSFGRLSAKRNLVGPNIDLPTMDYGRALLDNDGQHARWISQGIRNDGNVNINQSFLRGGNDYDREVAVSLRDDQLGQIIDAFSPAQTFNNLPPTSNGHMYEHGDRMTMGHGYLPPKARLQAGATRSSNMTTSRSSIRHDVNNGSRNASSSGQSRRSDHTDRPQDRPPVMYHPTQSRENRTSSQLRPPTSHPMANRVPTPNPFVRPTPTYDFDTYIANTPTQYGNHVRPTESHSIHNNVPNKVSSAHAPSAISAAKIRDGDPPHHSSHVHGSISHETRPSSHLSGGSHTARIVSGEDTVCHNSLHELTMGVTDVIEVIDVDAIDPNLDGEPQEQPRDLSPFKLNHKAGMSSMDSTGRLERQLFSALGEELDHFETQHIDTTEMGPELAAALAGASAPDSGNGQGASPATASDHSSTGKRKRHNTIGSEQEPGCAKKLDHGDDSVDQTEGGDEHGNLSVGEGRVQVGENEATPRV